MKYSRIHPNNLRVGDVFTHFSANFKVIKVKITPKNKIISYQDKDNIIRTAIVHNDWYRIFLVSRKSQDDEMGLDFL